MSLILDTSLRKKASLDDQLSHMTIYIICRIQYNGFAIALQYTLNDISAETLQTVQPLYSITIVDVIAILPTKSYKNLRKRA